MTRVLVGDVSESSAPKVEVSEGRLQTEALADHRRSTVLCPALARPHGAEALDSGPGRPAVDPGQVREDRFGVVPAALVPSAQPEPVQSAQEGRLVDQLTRQQTVEMLGKRLLADRDGGVIELEGRLRAVVVKGEAAELDPGVDAALVFREQVFQQRGGIPDVSRLP